jgi:hypothetical protein
LHLAFRILPVSTNTNTDTPHTTQEFADKPTPRSQITHLKSLLKDLGMSGRMSLEKARAIRTQREFAQELEDVVEYDAKINRNLKRKQEEAEKEAKGRARRSVSTTDDKKVLGQAAVAKKGAELDTDPESGSESSSEAEPGRKKRPKVSNIWS